MKIAIIGPTHPYKGGIAQHTTQLAHRLHKAGNAVDLISWRTQYPFFYPGAQFVPKDKPELPPFPHTKRVLSWKNPVGWWRWARRLRSYDKVILVWWVPTIQGPVYAAMLRAMGKRRPSITVICHNVLPHELRPGDKQLARAVLSGANQIIVHSPAQAAIARSLTAQPVSELALPFSWPTEKSHRGSKPQALHHQLLFFGFVRPYKGVDVLLKALAQVPDIKLTIAGEFWGGTTDYDDLITSLNLKNRVTILNEYIPTSELSTLMHKSDAVVLPYREGTATWNATLAFSYGLPVIATTAGTIAQHVKDTVDGLLCEPDDVPSLAKAIRHFYEPGVASKLQKGVPELSIDEDWDTYVAGVTKK